MEGSQLENAVTTLFFELPATKKSSYADYAINLHYASIGSPTQSEETIISYLNDLNTLNWRQCKELYNYMREEGARRQSPSDPLFFISRKTKSVFTGTDYRLGASYFLKEFIRKNFLVVDKKVSRTESINL